MWNIKERRLVHEIVIPALKEQLLIHAEFIDDRQVIVLSNTGHLIVVDAVEGTYVGRMDTVETVSFIV
jgi:hypothetical protein